jgi:chromatin remodeling complex protein RSC6
MQRLPKLYNGLSERQISASTVAYIRMIVATRHLRILQKDCFSAARHRPQGKGKTKEEETRLYRKYKPKRNSNDNVLPHARKQHNETKMRRKLKKPNRKGMQYNGVNQCRTAVPFHWFI